MLSHDDLTDLYADLRDRDVLSVYIDGDQHDPAERQVWRTRLEAALANRRREIEGTGNGSIEAFETARDRLLGALKGYHRFMPDRGWVGFATPDGVAHAGFVPVPMPDLVAWERGLRAAPYVRALKQERPVVVALVDRHHARIFSYREGEVTRTDEFRAGSELDAASPAQSSRRSGERSGTRGNAHEDARRQVEVRAERMLREVVACVETRAGSDGFVVVGGTRETGAHLMQALDATLRERAIELRSLHLEMTPAELREPTEDAATLLTQRFQDRLVTQIIDRARARGRGVLCEDATTRALRERRVDTLVLSRGFINEHTDHADRMIGTAFDQGADVEELSGPGADRIDAEGDGVGALLRW
ncbi:MAG: hypothetical protein RQ745_13515 [Longimicrobiales bacterium]|nr:hypothetical protein [Longimicrobiales bacterium]